MTRPDLDDLRRIYEHGAPKVMALLVWAEYLENVRDGLLRDYEALSAREVKLREALKVYADHDNWERETGFEDEDFPCDTFCAEDNPDDAPRDGWVIAEMALGGDND